MPITKAAKKATRNAARKRRRNVTYKTALRKLLKGARTGQKVDQSKLVKLIDKAAKVGVIHRNRAARLKSRIAKKLRAK
ncbi:30S ribosomal protein S20 [Candidatus Berkelbacteria bacterium]|nr:30S ribosomal protein S20 [Candidatus Berkelbacteria bacterium]